MIDQDKPVIFVDAECPNCGELCGNGGSSDTFHCYRCGWTGKIRMHPDDIKAIKEVMRRHKKQNKEATPMKFRDPKTVGVLPALRPGQSLRLEDILEGGA